MPDLSAIRREVAYARAARRNRNGWVAGALMAACVLVVSTAVAMSAFRTDNNSADHPVDHPASDSVELSGAPWVNGDPTGQSVSTTTAATATADQPSGSGSQSIPVTTEHRAPELVPVPPPELVAIPVVVTRHDGPVRHCQSQSIAWPVTSTGSVNTAALRQAVNECSVGFGNGPTVTARYSLPTLADVIRSSTLFASADVPANVDLGQRVLVVRMEGRFSELTADGNRPTVVQIYLTATDAQWIGSEDNSPVELSAFGAPVLPVP